MVIKITNTEKKDKLYFGIRRGTWEVLAIAIFFFMLLIILIPHVRAEDTNNSYVIVSNETPIIDTPMDTITPIPTNVPVGRRIDQGACVLPGETIDISGIGWYTGYLSYYGKYYDDLSGLGNFTSDDIYKINSHDLKHLYIEPSTFHIGWWFNFDPYKLGVTNANERVFYVSNSCNISAKESAKIVQEAINESQIRKAIIANLSRLPVKTESGIDFIISKNVSTTIDAPPLSHQWIFGNYNDDTNYDTIIPEYNMTTFSKEITNGLTEGKYDVIFIKPGKNGILEEAYDNKTKIITSPFRVVDDTVVRGFASRVVEDRLIKRINNSYDDSYEIWRIDLQQPDIQIMKLSQVPLTSNHSLIVISGYTNANAGTNLNIQMDANKTNGETYSLNTWNATVMYNDGLVAYRVWNVSFIANFNGIFPGQHDITVTSNDGAKAVAPFYVYRELPAHYKPPQYLEYIDNSPFIPPVIQTVRVEVPVPGPERIVTITPSEQQIYNAQIKAINASFWSWFAIVMSCIIGLYTAYRVVKYLISVRSRAE